MPAWPRWHEFASTGGPLLWVLLRCYLSRTYGKKYVRRSHDDCQLGSRPPSARSWRGGCFETSFIEGAYEIVASFMFAVGLWVALVAWVFAHRVWRGALAAAALGLAIFIAGVALLSGPDRYLPSGRCSGSFVD